MVSDQEWVFWRPGFEDDRDGKHRWISGESWSLKMAAENIVENNFDRWDFPNMVIFHAYQVGKRSDVIKIEVEVESRPSFFSRIVEPKAK